MTLYTRIKFRLLDYGSLIAYYTNITIKFLSMKLYFLENFFLNQPYQNKFFRLQYSKLTQRVAAFHALVPKISQKLPNSCTFPLSQYPKSETPKNWIFDPLSLPLLPGFELSSHRVWRDTFLYASTRASSRYTLFCIIFLYPYLNCHGSDNNRRNYFQRLI